MALSRSDTEKKSILSGTLLTGITAVAAAAELLKNLSEHLQFLDGMPLPMRLGLYLALAWIGITRLWRGLQRKSRVLDGNALRIHTSNPNHLRGRDEEVGRIIDLLPNHPI